ncbi:hypothetical protein MKK70_21260 [Methylobacterium sp. E-041]|uniref:hypothetical protein n=1 Tax=Methylobacterium sp. E-041 TaxID=2836573 RepID=UPI001FB8AA30|nr:hypothetical protein [Methylobacterium sp. E-041]MCJ2107859.1 hypothetical protein [Methylobacterium sp. E-041]
MVLRVQGLGPAILAAQEAAATAVAGSSAILDGVFTVDTLPDPAANVDRYARVTDLFGSTRDLVLAAKTGSLAYWKPVRPIFAATVPVAADMTLTALKSPSVMFLTGAVGTGVTRTLTLSQALAYPGASFEVRNDMTGLGALKLAGLNVGGLLSLAFGGTQRFFFDAATGWKQFS